MEIGTMTGIGTLGPVWHSVSLQKKPKTMSTSQDCYCKDLREDEACCWLTEYRVGNDLVIHAPRYALVVYDSLRRALAITNASELR